VAPLVTIRSTGWRGDGTQLLQRGGIVIDRAAMLRDCRPTLRSMPSGRAGNEPTDRV